MFDHDSSPDSQETHSMGSHADVLLGALANPELRQYAREAFQEIGGDAVRGALGKDGANVLKRHGRNKGEISKTRLAVKAIRTLSNPKSAIDTARQVAAGAYGGGRESAINYGRQGLHDALGGSAGGAQASAPAEAAPDLWTTPASEPAPPDIWGDEPASHNTLPPAGAPPEAFKWGDEIGPAAAPPIPESAQLFDGRR